MAPSPVSAAEEPSRWYRPITIKDQTFPVLLSADRWLNWRDTYGAPRMRLNAKTGVWQQTGTHQGIDIFTERAAPIVALAAGVVENVGWTFYSGWRVGIRGDDANYYFYAHMLADFAPGISLGARVTSGQQLGSIGSSGYGPVGTADEFPPHLHFGIESSKRGWFSPQLMLKELYERSMSTIALSQQEALVLRTRVKVLRSRMYGPGAPPMSALRSSIDVIDERIAAARALSLLDR